MARRKKTAPDTTPTTTAGELELIASYLRELPCAISDDERDAYAKRASEVQLEVEELTEQMRSEGKTLRDRRKMRELERSELLSWVRTGEQQRPVNVEERACYRTNRVVTVRTDTGTHVDERPMTAEERQGELPLGGNGHSEDAAAFEASARDAEELV